MSDLAPLGTKGNARLLAAGLFLSLCLLAFYDLAIVADADWTHLGDFLGIWSWSRFAHEVGVDRLYDLPSLRAFQAAMDPALTERFYPFLYPPVYLLLIWPLGWFGQATASVLWSLVMLGMFHIALFGVRWRGWLTIAAFTSPATVMTLICGQNGLLTAAFMLGGLLRLARRPILAGILLGMLGYKPHFAIMVPVVLLATGNRRAALSAVTTGAVIAAVAAVAFGPGMWLSWWAARAAGWDLVQSVVAEQWRLVPTLSAFLLPFGLDGTIAFAAQASSGLAAVAAVWICWRRAPGSALAIAAVPLATLLATPYAFIYDLPLVGGAMLLLAGAGRRGEMALSLPGVGVLACGFALPHFMAMQDGGMITLGAPTIALVLAWVTLSTSREAPRVWKARLHQPVGALAGS